MRLCPLTFGCPPSAVSAPWSTLNSSLLRADIMVRDSEDPDMGCPVAPARTPDGSVVPGAGVVPVIGTPSRSQSLNAVRRDAEATSV